MSRAWNSVEYLCSCGGVNPDHRHARVAALVGRHVEDRGLRRVLQLRVRRVVRAWSPMPRSAAGGRQQLCRDRCTWRHAVVADAPRRVDTRTSRRYRLPRPALGTRPSQCAAGVRVLAARKSRHGSEGGTGPRSRLVAIRASRTCGRWPGRCGFAQSTISIDRDRAQRKPNEESLPPGYRLMPYCMHHARAWREHAAVPPS